MNSQNEKINTDFGDLLKIYRFSNSSEKIYGFLVKSTATINVEGDENDQKKDKINPLLQEFPNLEASENNQDNQIKYIAKILADGENPEVVIKIHGYSSKENDVTQQYSGVIDDIKEYLNNPKTDKKKTFVFFGYRWPSESPNFNNAFKAI